MNAKQARLVAMAAADPATVQAVPGMGPADFTECYRTKGKPITAAPSEEAQSRNHHRGPGKACGVDAEPNSRCIRNGKLIRHPVATSACEHDIRLTISASLPTARFNVRRSATRSAAPRAAPMVLHVPAGPYSRAPDLEGLLGCKRRWVPGWKAWNV